MKKIYNSYLKSGVNISAANKFVKHISKLTKKMTKKRKIPFPPVILVLLDHCMISVN